MHTNKLKSKWCTHVLHATAVSRYSSLTTSTSDPLALASDASSTKRAINALQSFGVRRPYYPHSIRRIRSINVTAGNGIPKRVQIVTVPRGCSEGGKERRVEVVGRFANPRRK
jgi:hypothetical protein